MIYFCIMQTVSFKDLGRMAYQEAWDYQEALLARNVEVKSNRFGNSFYNGNDTTNYFLVVEHPDVYTLGKSGNIDNVLLTDKQRESLEIQFFKTNRGGDITYHGPGQLVGYPILDLEKFRTDINWYMRSLEDVIILTLEEYGIKSSRSAGETGVWIDPEIPGKERKICAMGVRCSRWITMHGFALNINTNLDFFNHIIPCGIPNKAVTSMQKELGRTIDENEVKKIVKKNFELVFEVQLDLFQ